MITNRCQAPVRYLALEAGVVGVEGGTGGGYDGHGEQFVHVHDLERVADLGQVGGQVTQAQVLAVARAVASGRYDADPTVAVDDSFAIVGHDGGVAALDETFTTLAVGVVFDGEGATDRVGALARGRPGRPLCR